MNSQSTRERLIDAGYQLARIKGFDRTSVNEIMAASDVKKGSFYHHFPNKDSLGLAVLERDRIDFLAMLDSSLEAPTPLEGIDSFFATAILKHAATGFAGGCLWGNTATEMSDTNPAFTELVIKVFNEWLDRIERTLRAGQDAGQIRTDLSANELARLVVAAMEGGILMARLAKQEYPLKQCLSAVRTLITDKCNTSRADTGKEYAIPNTA